MLKILGSNLSLCVMAVLASSCGGEQTQVPEAEVVPGTSIATSAEDVSSAPNQANWEESEELSDIVSEMSVDQISSVGQVSGEIPYPLYPNGTRYRIGGENGLTVVLFQTEDSFDQVDAYFQSQADMLRLSAMPDYARYTISQADNDPWETSKPGIVIHEFNDESEKLAVGADQTARTNIIMSY